MIKIGIWIPLEHYQALTREAICRGEQHRAEDVAAGILWVGSEALAAADAKARR